MAYNILNNNDGFNPRFYPAPRESQPAFWVVGDTGVVGYGDFGGGGSGGVSGFFGVGVYDDFRPVAIPHGPVYIRYWLFKDTKTAMTFTVDEGGDTVTLYPGSSTLEGPYYLLCVPSYFTDSDGYQWAIFVNGVAIPDLRVSADGVVPEVDSDYTFVGGGNLSGGCAGLWNFFNGEVGFPYNSNTKFSNNLWPAFDMGDTWYQQVDIVTVTSGTSTTTTLLSYDPYVFGEYGPTDFAPDGPFVMSEVYGLKQGYTLVSQTTTERVWHKTNASGGTDSITITLSNVATDPFGITARRAETDGLAFDFGQVVFLGYATTNDLTAAITRVQTYTQSAPNTYPDLSTDYSYLEANGKAVFINPDGTLSINTITIPGGGDTVGDYSGGGKLLAADYKVPGSIFWGVGMFDVPTFFEGTFNTSAVADLVAEV